MPKNLTRMKEKLSVVAKLYFWVNKDGWLCFDGECELKEGSETIALFELCDRGEDGLFVKNVRYVVEARGKYTGLRKLVSEIVESLEVDFLSREVDLLVGETKTYVFAVKEPYIG